MSYGAPDFADDTEANADTYKVPHVDPADLPDYDEYHDGLRLLAERTARAFSQRREYLDVIRDLVEHADRVVPGWLYGSPIENARAIIADNEE